MLFCKCKQEEEKDERQEQQGNKLKSVLAVRWVV